MRHDDRAFASRRPPAELLAAAQRGDSEAQVLLAESLAALNDGETAVAWVRRAVEGGNRYAGALLGVWEVLGYHVDVDMAAGLRRTRPLRFRTSERNWPSQAGVADVA